MSNSPYRDEADAIRARKEALEGDLLRLGKRLDERTARLARLRAEVAATRRDVETIGGIPSYWRRFLTSLGLVAGFAALGASYFAVADWIPYGQLVVGGVFASGCFAVWRLGKRERRARQKQLEHLRLRLGEAMRESEGAETPKVRVEEAEEVEVGGSGARAGERSR